MTGQALTARERHTLERLREAEELGVSLEYYAKSYELDLQQLHHHKAQLEQKGLWPIKPSPAQTVLSTRRAELLAVRVVSQEAKVAEPAREEGENQALRVKLTAPNGWVLECDRWPEAPWLTALMGGGA